MSIIKIWPLPKNIPGTHLIHLIAHLWYILRTFITFHLQNGLAHCHQCVHSFTHLWHLYSLCSDKIVHILFIHDPSKQTSLSAYCSEHKSLGYKFGSPFKKSLSASIPLQVEFSPRTSELLSTCSAQLVLQVLPYQTSSLKNLIMKF